VQKDGDLTGTPGQAGAPTRGADLEEVAGGRTGSEAAIQARA
jgi:hypothetical protein